MPLKFPSITPKDVFRFFVQAHLAMAVWCGCVAFLYYVDRPLVRFLSAALAVAGFSALVAFIVCDQSSPPSSDDRRNV